MQSLLNRTIKKESAKPKYLICDKGKQFWCESFKDWCGQKGIRPRFGAVGKKGSIAVIERFIGSLKSECMDVILVPIREGISAVSWRSSRIGTTVGLSLG